jgi:hypothetical protein
MIPDCLPCAGASRPTIKRLVGRKVFLNMKILENFGQNFKISNSSTPTVCKQSQIIIFSDGHWTAGFRALPETA